MTRPARRSCVVRQTTLLEMPGKFDLEQAIAHKRSDIQRVAGLNGNRRAGWNASVR